MVCLSVDGTIAEFDSPQLLRLSRTTSYLPRQVSQVKGLFLGLFTSHFHAAGDTFASLDWWSYVMDVRTFVQSSESAGTLNTLRLIMGQDAESDNVEVA